MTDFAAERAAIISALKSAKRAVVISHYNPDADAYGASCAMALALRARGTEAVLVNESGAEPRYAFIAGVSEVKRSWDPEPGDVLVVCDCGDQKRVGDTLVAKVKEAAVVINIDHHGSNDMFGRINLVNGRASSTSELVYQIIEDMGCAISTEIASALLAGLVGDTGSFRYPSTSARTFEIAKRLVEAGASPSATGQEIFGRCSIGSVKLHAAALLNLSLHAEDRMCELVVTQEMLDACKATTADTELLVEKGRDIEGVEISYLARKEKDLWHVSMRSKHESFDVSTVARFFGGGGHKSAAAFRWRKSYEELKPQLLEKLGALLNPA